MALRQLLSRHDLIRVLLLLLLMLQLQLLLLLVVCCSVRPPYGRRSGERFVVLLKEDGGGSGVGRAARVRVHVRAHRRGGLHLVEFELGVVQERRGFFRQDEASESDTWLTRPAFGASARRQALVRTHRTSDL